MSGSSFHALLRLLFFVFLTRGTVASPCQCSICQVSSAKARHHVQRIPHDPGHTQRAGSVRRSLPLLLQELQAELGLGGSTRSELRERERWTLGGEICEALLKVTNFWWFSAKPTSWQKVEVLTSKQNMYLWIEWLRSATEQWMLRGRSAPRPLGATQVACKIGEIRVLGGV